MTEQITEIKVTKITSNEQFDKLYKDSAYTITGAGGPIEKWIKGYTEMLEKEGIGKPIEFFIFKGKQMNEKYNLSGNVAYPNDLTFISFPLEGLKVNKLAIFKLRMQDRRFDDIVDNNQRHMEGL